MQTNVNRKFVTNYVITPMIALVTGFRDRKISYYTAFRDRNNSIGDNSEMAPSTSFTPFRYTENLREVTNSRSCLTWGCVVGVGGGAKFSLRICM